MTSVSLAPDWRPYFQDLNGDPAENWKIYVYESETTDYMESYQDPKGTVKHEQPIVIGPGGLLPGMGLYLIEGQAYTLILVDQEGAAVPNGEVNDVYGVSGSTIPEGKVKVSGQDSELGFLSEKLTAKGNVSLNTTNPGENETIEIEVESKVSTSEVDSTNGWLGEKLIAGENITLSEVEGSNGKAIKIDASNGESVEMSALSSWKNSGTGQAFTPAFPFPMNFAQYENDLLGDYAEWSANNAKITAAISGVYMVEAQCTYAVYQSSLMDMTLIKLDSNGDETSDYIFSRLLKNDTVGAFYDRGVGCIRGLFSLEVGESVQFGYKNATGTTFIDDVTFSAIKVETACTDGATIGVEVVIAGDGINVDSTDPTAPIVTNIGVRSVVAGDNVTVDNTDPYNPIINGTPTGIEEAPVDGKIYGREDASWVETETLDTIQATDLESVTRTTSDEQSTLRFFHTDGTFEEIVTSSSVNTPTGLLEGGVLSAGDPQPDASVIVSAGAGYIADYTTDKENPALIRYEWPLTELFIQATTQFVTVGVQGDGVGGATVFFKDGAFFTPEEKRQNIQLGHAVTVSTVIPYMDVIPSKNQSAAFFDYIDKLGYIKDGGVVTENSETDLHLDMAEMVLSKPFISWQNSPNNPNSMSSAEQLDLVFLYTYQDGAGDWTLVPTQTTINPGQWDDGDGTLGTVLPNSFTVQRLYYSLTTASYTVLYGQKLYSTYNDAVIGINDEIEIPDFINNPLVVELAYIIAKGNSSNLSVTGESAILSTGRLAGVTGAGGSGGGSVTTHNVLPDLQGGAVNEYYHLSADEYANATTGLADYVLKIGDTMTGKLEVNINGEAIKIAGASTPYARWYNGATTVGYVMARSTSLYEIYSYGDMLLKAVGDVTIDTDTGVIGNITATGQVKSDVALKAGNSSVATLGVGKNINADSNQNILFLDHKAKDGYNIKNRCGGSSDFGSDIVFQEVESQTGNVRFNKDVQVQSLTTENIYGIDFEVNINANSTVEGNQKVEGDLISEGVLYTINSNFTLSATQGTVNNFSFASWDDGCYRVTISYNGTNGSTNSTQFTSIDLMKGFRNEYFLKSEIGTGHVFDCQSHSSGTNIRIQSSDSTARTIKITAIKMAAF